MNAALYIIFISMLPFIELRGAIPIGMSLGMPFWEVWIFSIIGNIIPILPILILFQPISKLLLRFKWFQRLYDWLYQRSARKGKDQLNRYGAVALFLFTAIPLPTTGAWSAALIASFFQIKIRYAFFSILLGVISAAFLVGGLSHMLF